MRPIKPSLLAATVLALALVSSAAVDSARNGRSARENLDAAEAAQKETINLAVTGMT